MDRTTFLKALPFLFPLESSEWPPRLPEEATERNSCRRETFLQDHMLAVETWKDTLQNSSGQEKVPSQRSICQSRVTAFFIKETQDKSHDNTNTTKPAMDSKMPTSTTKNNDENDNDFDPAMSPLELIVQSSNLLIPPDIIPTHVSNNDTAGPSNGFVSPSAYHKLLNRNQLKTPHKKSQGGQPQEAQSVRETAVLIKVDGVVYQVDLRQIENIHLELMGGGGENNLENDNVNANNDISSMVKPPSLLLQFGKLCVFRIFSMQGTLDSGDSYTRLSSLETLLVHVLTGNDQVPCEFPCTYLCRSSHSATSPTGGGGGCGDSSSTTVGFYHEGENGQPTEFQDTPKTNGTSDSNGEKHNNNNGEEYQGDKSDLVETKETNNDAMSSQSEEPNSVAKLPDGEQDSTSDTPEYSALLKRSQTAYATTRAHVEMLDNLLNRTNTSQAGASFNQSAKKQIRDIMTSIPKNLALSYANPADVEKAIQRCNEEIWNCRAEVDEIVKSFWPNPKRQRTTASAAGTSSAEGGLSRQTSLDRRPQMSAEECIERIKELQAKHRAAVQERVELLCLPKRGSTW